MILESVIDAYDGVTVDPRSYPAAAEAFVSMLRESLDRWRSDGRRLVWLPIPLERALFVPFAASEGFGFHHTRGDILVMYLLLAADAVIPPYATHNVGAGGVVINDRNELLVVSERYRRSTANPHYKLPGGSLEPGEHIVDCVMREIMEETGVRTRFRALVCFRHWHGYRFGTSDIYFVCRLEPLTAQITIHQGEISECMWMPIEEYLGREDIHLFNKRIVRAALSSDGIPAADLPGYGTPETHEFFIPANREPYGSP